MYMPTLRKVARPTTHPTRMSLMAGTTNAKTETPSPDTTSSDAEYMRFSILKAETEKLECPTASKHQDPECDGISPVNHRRRDNWDCEKDYEEDCHGRLGGVACMRRASSINAISKRLRY